MTEDVQHASKAKELVNSCYLTAGHMNVLCGQLEIYRKHDMHMSENNILETSNVNLHNSLGSTDVGSLF
jgi:hypothetical protein